MMLYMLYKCYDIYDELINGLICLLDNMEDDITSLPSTSHGSLCSDTPNPGMIDNLAKPLPLRYPLI